MVLVGAIGFSLEYFLKVGQHAHGSGHKLSHRFRIDKYLAAPAVATKYK